MGHHGVAFGRRTTRVVTLEQLTSLRGSVVASTVLAKAPFTREARVGSRLTPR